MVSVEARPCDQDREEMMLYVLTSTGLQKWQLTLDDADKFYYEADVTSLAREAVWSVWPGNQEDGGSAAWLRIWLVDLSVNEEGMFYFPLTIDNISVWFQVTAMSWSLP